MIVPCFPGVFVGEKEKEVRHKFFLHFLLVFLMLLLLLLLLFGFFWLL